MVNALKLKNKCPARILLAGYPGSGKTGSLCSLVNAGFKLRVLDFDKNYAPLTAYSNDAMLERNVDIVPLEDKLRKGNKVIEPFGTPTAWPKALALMDRWKYTEDGVETDLGCSKDWGPDTIVVVDSLTSMGDCVKRYALSIANRDRLRMRDSDWGVAMGEQKEFLDMLRADSNRFHLIVMSHLKIVGPREIRQGDDEITQALKKSQSDMIPTRYYPSALGRQLPPEIPGMFNTMLLAERKVTAGNVRRIIRTDVGEEMDIKIPANIPKQLDIATGMIDVFKALVPWAVEAVAKGKGETNAVQQSA